MSAPKAFILHLERATGRKATVEALRAALPLESEVVAAVDGARLPSDTVARAYRRTRFAPRYPFALGLPEIGAFLSHRSAWRRIVDGGLDFAIVFEDDAAVDPLLLTGLLDFLKAKRGMWDYVLTPAAGLEPPGQAIIHADAFSLIRPHAPPLRAIAQFVSCAAAERLLELTEPFDRPVDTLLQMTWITGVPLLVAAPTPIRDVSQETGGTTVQRSRMGFMDRARRELFRPLYRARVLALHRQEAARPDWRSTVMPRISLPEE